jgi:hypothetical protein
MRKLRFVVLGSVVALLVASMPAAVADTQLFVRSEPNGDISASAQSVASSDKDKDGDPDTLTRRTTSTSSSRSSTWPSSHRRCA